MIPLAATVVSIRKEMSLVRESLPKHGMFYSALAASRLKYA